MKLSNKIVTIALNVCLASLIIPGVLSVTAAAQTQDLRVALQRGYRTGYSDGYMAGYRDTIDSLAKDYSRHAEYSKADRAFNKDYGTIEEYRDGYQQGFESGYDTGFEKRSFESSLPTDLSKRGMVAIQNQNSSTTSDSTSAQNQNDTGITVKNEQTADTRESSDSTSYRNEKNPIIIIPRDTELILELQNDLNTERSREGERFTAKVVSPSEIAGATIEGRVSKIRQPGRLKRRSEMLLSFDRIVLNDNRWSNFSAILTEVMPVKGDNVKLVDSEGTAIGRSSLKDDGIKVGAATGTGLVIGAIAGGPVGAAVGAGVGAAFGVGAVVIERGKHVRLNRNQQLRIKTGYETQIR